MTRWALGPAIVLASLVAALGCLEEGRTDEPKRHAPAVDTAIRIDLDHILKGRVNSRGDLVGLHHEPSAPKRIRAEGAWCDVEFRPTSPGDEEDVRTARVLLTDPTTGRVVLEKFSTLFPSAWSREEIEASIREAYADAKAKRRVSDRGKWEGRTRQGVRIDGYMTYDGKAIATAFPVYEPPRGERGRR